MGIFGSLFGRKEPATGSVREVLFGDVPLDRWPEGRGKSFPWIEFEAARFQLSKGRAADAIACWRAVLTHAGLESRHYLQAWHFLRQHQQTPPPEVAKQVLGVIVEVGMPQGLDILAAYADHSARYYNFAGAGVVWEGSDDPVVNALIDGLLTAGTKVAAVIGSSQESRPPAPKTGQARLSFLTPSGLHFGQGPQEALQRDPLAGPVFQAGTKLMLALIAKSNPDQPTQPGG